MTTGDFDFNRFSRTPTAAGPVVPGPAAPARAENHVRVIGSLDEMRAAVDAVAASAQRLMTIYTPDLEPDLYDQNGFLEIVKRFVLARRFAKVRVLLSDSGRLLRDNNRFIAMGRRLEDAHYSAFEEPCPYWELEWTREVTEALDIDVQGGEQDNDMAQWRRMIAMRAVDIVQPDICYTGGLTRAWRVAQMADAAGLPVKPHAANVSLVTVFTLHLMGAIENAGPYVEFSIEGADYYPWDSGLYEPALVARDGKVRIPDGPGWGVELNKHWLEKASYQKSGQ